MSKKITPQDVAKQLHWEIDQIADFSAEMFEDANDHNLAAALRAMNVMGFDLACEFIHLEKDHIEAGHLTEELRKRRDQLMDRLKELQG